MDTKIKQLYWFLSLRFSFSLGGLFVVCIFRPSVRYIVFESKLRPKMTWESNTQKKIHTTFYMCQLFGRTHKFSASINGICSNQGIFIALTTVQKVDLLLYFFCIFCHCVPTSWRILHSRTTLWFSVYLGVVALLKNTVGFLFLSISL